MRLIKPSLNIENCYLAGGAVLSLITKTPINDYDIYPKNENGLIRAIEEFKDRGTCVNITNKAATFILNDETDDDGRRRLAQIILGSYFPTHDSIFEKFDFSVCMAAYDFDDKTFHTNEDTMIDIASRTLRFNHRTQYPLASLVRLKKYKAKGYNISKAELVKMALSVARAGMPTSWTELENTIGGIYGRSICLSKDENGNEIPFEFDTVIDRLSNTDEANLDIIQDDGFFGSLSFDDLINMLTGDNNIYVISANKRYYNMITDPDGFHTILSSAQDKILDYYNNMGNKNVIHEKNKTLFGYKVLSANGSGELLPGIVGAKNGITYAIGKATEYEKSPYLYVFNNKEVAKKRLSNKGKLYRVTFNSNDIMGVSSNEIQVKRMTVLSEVE